MSRGVLVLCAIISVCSGMQASKYSPVSGVDAKWHKSEDDSLFYIEPEEKFNWYDAWNECARKNMSLIAIEYHYKHIQIDTLIKKLFVTCPSFWIGGHDNAIDLRYEWPMTGEVFSFTNWAANQPDRLNNNEHCILIWQNTWQWFDSPCVNKAGFICEENRYIKEMSRELENLKKECQDKAKELENLRQECLDKTSGMSGFKHPIMQFNLNSKFVYSYGKSIDLDK